MSDENVPKSLRGGNTREHSTESNKQSGPSVESPIEHNTPQKVVGVVTDTGQVVDSQGNAVAELHSKSGNSPNLAGKLITTTSDPSFGQSETDSLEQPGAIHQEDPTKAEKVEEGQEVPGRVTTAYQIWNAYHLPITSSLTFAGKLYQGGGPRASQEPDSSPEPNNGWNVIGKVNSAYQGITAKLNHPKERKDMSSGQSSEQSYQHLEASDKVAADMENSQSNLASEDLDALSHDTTTDRSKETTLGANTNDLKDEGQQLDDHTAENDRIRQSEMDDTKSNASVNSTGTDDRDEFVETREIAGHADPTNSEFRIDNEENAMNEDASKADSEEANVEDSVPQSLNQNRAEKHESKDHDLNAQTEQTDCEKETVNTNTANDLKELDPVPMEIRDDSQAVGAREDNATVHAMNQDCAETNDKDQPGSETDAPRHSSVTADIKETATAQQDSSDFGGRNEPRNSDSLHQADKTLSSVAEIAIPEHEGDSKNKLDPKEVDDAVDSNERAPEMDAHENEHENEQLPNEPPHSSVSSERGTVQSHSEQVHEQNLPEPDKDDSNTTKLNDAIDSDISSENREKQIEISDADAGSIDVGKTELEVASSNPSNREPVMASANGSPVVEGDDNQNLSSVSPTGSTGQVIKEKEKKPADEEGQAEAKSDKISGSGKEGTLTQPEVAVKTSKGVKRKQQPKPDDEKLAKEISDTVQASMDQIDPICKKITERVNKAEKTPKDKLDEKKLVQEVQPLIEQGNKILNETNAKVRKMDPDGRIQKNAKMTVAAKVATPAEEFLTQQLKTLSGTITSTIDNAKKKVDKMPYAKKQLEPMWEWLLQPLVEIIAAVGLLLTGVLGLVGRLLRGLGLGFIVDRVINGLHIKDLIGGLGFGDALGALTKAK